MLVEAQIGGVATEWRRGIGPVAVLGPRLTQHPGDTPICPGCGLKMSRRQGVLLCRTPTDTTWGPPSRADADKAAVLVIDVPTTTGNDTIRPDPGTVLLIYVKG